MYAKILRAVVLFVALVGASSVHASIYGEPEPQWYPTDVDSAIVVDIASYGVRKYEEIINAHYDMGLEKVVFAMKKDIANGFYNVSMIAYTTDCKKEGHWAIPIDAPEEPVEPESTHCSVTKFHNCAVMVEASRSFGRYYLWSIRCGESDYERNYATGLLVPGEEEPEIRRRVVGKLSKLFGRRHHH